MRNKGSASLIELLLGMVIGLFIIMAVLTLFNTIFGSDSKTRYLDNLDEAKNNIRVELSNAIRWAESVSTNPDNSIVADDVTIAFEDDTIYKRPVDGVHTNILPDSIIVSNVQVEEFTTSPDAVSLIIDMDLTHRNKTDVTENLHLVITQRVLNAE